MITICRNCHYRVLIDLERAQGDTVFVIEDDFGFTAEVCIANEHLRNPVTGESRAPQKCETLNINGQCPYFKRANNKFKGRVRLNKDRDPDQAEDVSFLTVSK